MPGGVASVHGTLNTRFRERQLKPEAPCPGRQAMSCDVGCGSVVAGARRRIPGESPPTSVGGHFAAFALPSEHINEGRWRSGRGHCARS